MPSLQKDHACRMESLEFADITYFLRYNRDEA